MDERDILQEEPSANVPIVPEPPPTATAAPKALVRAFVVCVICAVALLIGQFYVAVFRQPVFRLAAATPEEDPDADLKAKDTDLDGISDYDEINLYFTSPYLADADSDGTPDREELVKGTDPNCPTGKLCANFEPTATIRPEEIGPPEPTPPSGVIPGIGDAANLTPDQLRELLRQNGMTEDEIEQLSDEQLMTIYENALGANAEQTQTPSTGGTGIPANPTPAQIRELLVKNGADKSVIDGLSDAELVKLYQDTLKQFSGGTTAQ